MIIAGIKKTRSFYIDSNSNQKFEASEKKILIYILIYLPKKVS